MAPTPPSVAVAVPIRSFDGAKSRLSGVLSPSERSAAARHWADVVLDAASEWARLVITDDAFVAGWAADRGATAVAPGRGGLDAAAQAALTAARDTGFDIVVVAHGDLPLVRSLEVAIPRHGEIVIAPDRTRDGTNVIAMPTSASFDFRYGPDSFARHLVAATVGGRALRTVENTDLSFDVDDPQDLADLAELHETGHSVVP